MLSRLRRITRDGRWIPEIDSLRFIAIFSVFLFHLHGELLVRSGAFAVLEPRYVWLFHGIRQGYRGVELFFVISGFILGLPFARHCLKEAPKVRLGKYFLRRLTRLEPPYIASFLAAALLWGVFTRGAGLTRAYMEHVGAGILYINNFLFRGENPANPVTWSLEIEIQFYILAPVFALLFWIRNAATRRGLMIFCIAACGAVQAVFLEQSTLARYSIADYAQYFLAGMLLADLYLTGLRMRSGWLDALAVAGWCVYFEVPETAWAQVLFPFLLLLLCSIALNSRYLGFFFANQTIAVIGGMCYSIYLLHFLLLAAFFKFTRHLIVPGDYLVSFVIQFLTAGIPVLLICAFYYTWVERIFMDPEWPAKLRRHFGTRRQSEVKALAETEQEPSEAL